MTCRPVSIRGRGPGRCPLWRLDGTRTTGFHGRLRGPLDTPGPRSDNGAVRGRTRGGGSLMSMARSGGLVLLLGMSRVAAAGDVDTDGERFFRDRVAPVLERRCVQC